MFNLDVKIDTKDLDSLVRDVQAADSAAARSVARAILIPAARQALSFQGVKAPIGRLGKRSGRTVAQVKAKFFKGKDGLMNGAVKVIGDRAHISRFNESGTKNHGRNAGPLPARRMFEITGTAIRAQAEAMLVSEFEANMKAKGFK